jgi:hypothetical protein
MGLRYIKLIHFLMFIIQILFIYIFYVLDNVNNWFFISKLKDYNEVQRE